MQTDQNNQNKGEEKKKVFGDPEYDADQDIYSKEEKESFDEEKGPGQKGKPDPLASANDENLDVPGSELDDTSETLGEEDEENNYYSLGGDQHNDLDEDRGE